MKNSYSKCFVGFTLMEVLVALVIAGLVVGVFFQVLAAGLRLEFRSAEVVREVTEIRRIMDALMAMDVQDSEFAWSGEDFGLSWSLGIEPVETVHKRGDLPEEVRLPGELYRYVLAYSMDRGRQGRIVRYVWYEPGFFHEEFKRTHFR